MSTRNTKSYDKPADKRSGAGDKAKADQRSTGRNRRNREPSVAIEAELVEPDDDGDPNDWSQVPLFSGLGQEAIEALRGAMQLVEFADGHEIITQGASGKDMFVLQQGAVRVCVANAEGTITYERRLVAPALFGEIALVTNEARSASVFADGPATCQRLGKEQVVDLVLRNPPAARLLTALVGKRLLEAGTIRRVGKYGVVGRLGSGGFATVFEAIHPSLGQHVALKMLSHALVLDPKFREHFDREARLIARLDHEGIVRVLDVEECYGTRFIVMEKLLGSELEEVIRTDIRLDWDTIRGVLLQTAAALAYSHSRGIVHRDIKPSNLFLTPDGRVKILDFGIARDLAGEGETEGRLVGTPYYMSPEQVRAEKLDGRTDLYSLGIVAFELATMRVPFLAETAPAVMVQHLTSPIPDMRALRPDIPDDIVEFVRRSTAKDRADRFGSCAEAHDWLKAEARLPLVRELDLASLGVSFHPSRRAAVHAVLHDAASRLSSMNGVSAHLATWAAAHAHDDLGED